MKSKAFEMAQRLHAMEDAYNARISQLNDDMVKAKAQHQASLQAVEREKSATVDTARKQCRSALAAIDADVAAYVADAEEEIKRLLMKAATADQDCTSLKSALEIEYRNYARSVREERKKLEELEGRIPKRLLKRYQPNSITPVQADRKRIEYLLDRVCDDTLWATVKGIIRIDGYYSRKDMACDLKHMFDEAYAYIEETMEKKKRGMLRSCQEADQRAADVKRGTGHEVDAANARIEAYRAKAAPKRDAAVASQNRTVRDALEQAVVRQRGEEESLRLRLSELDAERTDAEKRYQANIQNLNILGFLQAEATRMGMLRADRKPWGADFAFADAFPPAFPVGFIGQPINIHGGHRKLLEKEFRGILSPRALSGFAYETIDDDSSIWIEFEKSRDAVISGINFILASRVALSPFDGVRIVFCDAKDMAHNLGMLSALANRQDGAIAFASIARTAQEVAGALVAENQNMARIGQTLGAYTDIVEYNRKSVGDTIPYTVVVVNDIDDEFFPVAAIDNLRSMIRNAKAFGYKFIVSSHDISKVKDEKKRAMLEALQKSFSPISEIDGGFRLSNGLMFKFYSDDVVTDSFLRSFIQCYDSERKKREDATVNVDVSRFITADGQSVFGRRHIMAADPSDSAIDGDLAVPFALDAQGDVVKFIIGQQPTLSSIVTGSTRSGKTVMLHSIINGIAANFYPSEVELWLVDFKSVEFKRYQDVPLPHISLIGLSEDDQFAASLLEKIEDEFGRRRTALLKTAGVERIDRYNSLENKPATFRPDPESLEEPCPDYLRHIVLIIDEFSVMSKYLSKHRMEEDFAIILKKYGALGLYCIFANQSIKNNDRLLLTEDALAQASGRIGFRNDNPRESHSLFFSDYANAKMPELYSLIRGRAVYRSGKGYQLVDNVLISDALTDKIADVDEREFGRSKLTVVDQRERSTFDLDVIADVLSAANASNGTGVCCIGESMSLINPSFMIEVKQTRFQNVFSLGSNDDLRFSVSAATVASLAEQDWHLVIFSSKQSSVYGRYKNLSMAFNSEFFDTPQALYELIVSTAESLGQNCKSRELILLDASMEVVEEMLDDWDLFFPALPAAGDSQSEGQTASESLTEEEEYAKLLEETMLARKELSTLAFDGSHETGRNTPGPKSTEEPSPDVFVEAFVRLLSKGSRRGVSVMISEPSFVDLAERKLFGRSWPNNKKMSELFGHRFASRLQDRTVDRVMGFGEHASGITREDENMVMVYSDELSNVMKFKPFEVSW